MRVIKPIRKPTKGTAVRARNVYKRVRKNASTASK